MLLIAWFSRIVAVPYGMRTFSALISFFLVALAVFPAQASAAEELATASFERRFSEANRLLNDDRFAEGAEVLDGLLLAAQERGFTGLGGYALAVLKRVPLLEANGELTEAAYLVRRAVALAPEDPWVLFAASGHFRLLGYSEALQLAVRGCVAGLKSPPTVVGLAFNALIIGLVALTLASMMVVLVQLVCNVKRVLINATKKTSVYTKGLLGPILLLAIMLLPLFGGLLFALGCWALVLSRCIKECRGLGVLVGGVILTWGLSLSVLQTFYLQLQSPLNTVLAHMKGASFYVGDLAILEEAARTSREPALQFALGAALTREGRLGEAGQLYAELVAAGDPDAAGEISAAALLNRGAILFNQGMVQEAKELWLQAERAGDTSFELWHNLAQAHLVLLDTAGHREYYQRAMDEDASRLQTIDQTAVDGKSAVLFVGTSAWPYLRRFFRPVPAEEAALYGDRVEKQRAVAQTLLASGSNVRICLWGGLILLLSIGASRRGRGDFYRYRDGALEHSGIWLLLPAGPFMVGNKPGVGLLLLGALIALLMLGLGEPHITVPLFPESFPFDAIFVGAAAVLMASSALWSLLDGPEQL